MWDVRVSSLGGWLQHETLTTSGAAPLAIKKPKQPQRGSQWETRPHLPWTQPATGCLHCSMPIPMEKHLPLRGKWGLLRMATHQMTPGRAQLTPASHLCLSQKQRAVVRTSAWGTGFCSTQRWLALGPSQDKSSELLHQQTRTPDITRLCKCQGNSTTSREHFVMLRSRLQTCSNHRQAPAFSAPLHHSPMEEQHGPPATAASHPALHICIQLQRKRGSKMNPISLIYTLRDRWTATTSCSCNRVGGRGQHWADSSSGNLQSRRAAPTASLQAPGVCLSAN